MTSLTFPPIEDSSPEASELANFRLAADQDYYRERLQWWKDFGAVDPESNAAVDLKRRSEEEGESLRKFERSFNHNAGKVFAKHYIIRRKK